MRKTKKTLEQFTTSGETMSKAAGIFIKAVIYENVATNRVIQDFNNLLDSSHLPYEIKYTADIHDTINYLRFEAERLDRALYVLSCLVEPVKKTKKINN